MTSSHSNKVDIQGSDIVSIEYIDKSLVITSGQPSSPPPGIHRSGNTWTIDMECGRKGNSSVASQFTQECGGVNHIYCPTATSDPSPDDLNFYFGIRVGFKVGDEIYYVRLNLGQGHRASNNNWWIGGQCVAHNSPTILNIIDVPTDELKEVYTISGGISNFELDPWLAKEGLSPQPRWLKAISDDKLICDINIPGTHDSAAINRVIPTPYACHSHTLSEQLTYGVRLLDIRLSVHEENAGQFSFMTCHGTNEYQSFPSALQECQTFLTANPSEFIAMSLKVDTWNAITNKVGACNALQTLLSGYPVFIAADMPKLKDVRGKIYLLNRITNDYTFGPPLSWTDQTPGQWLTSSRNFKVYVQDKYTNLGFSATAEKYRLFIAALPVTSPGEMLLNFASGVQGFMGVYIMGLVLEYFGDNVAGARPSRLGWALFDYITSSYSTNIYGNLTVLQLIISSNFGYKGYENKFKVNVKDEL